MRVCEVQEQFGIANLKAAERPEPTPGAGELRLRMAAHSLNFRDLLMIKGQYNPRQPLPLIPLSDGVGRVEVVGAGVEGFAEGDRVCPIFTQDWIAGEVTKKALRTTLGGPLDGTLAEQMVVPASAAVKVPEYLSDEEAATLPCAAVTAWSALKVQGDVKAGDTVLLQGTGGVSIFALQFAKMLGAKVIITSSQDEKLERALALGADHGLNYRQEPKWGKAASKLTGRRGVDHVIEVGGAGTLEQSLAAVRPGGTISVIGVLAGVASPLNILPILMRNIRLQGVFVGHREGFEGLCRAMAQHEPRPVISHRFKVEQIGEALNLMAAGGHFGKITLSW